MDSDSSAAPYMEIRFAEVLLNYGGGCLWGKWQF